MEKELNIAAILKDKPENTKLYSAMIGECFLKELQSSLYPIFVDTKNRGTWHFLKDGKFEEEGECMLFPSKSMRSWSKFAWKKGDVLKVATGGDCTCIFDRFTNDDYTEFTGLFDKYLDRFDCFATSDWCKVTDEKECESIIQRIETQYGGKLNLDTLKIEKPQFKDGDIIKHGKNIYIVQNFTDSYVHIYAGLIGKTDEVITRRLGISSNFGCSNLATDSEKQQLFDALAKEGKRWNSETKTLEDLPKKCEFKPFDKVLCRNSKDDTWEADFFSRLTQKEIDFTASDKYLCIGDLWMYCIPYNDQTAHLLGTTDDWKGGE